MIAVLAALAAFFVPPAVGLVSRARMAGVWLTAAMCEVPVCLAFNQPLAFVTTVLSMMLAAMAIGVSRPYPSLRTLRRREDQEVEAFIREVEVFVWEAADADTDPYGPGPVS